MAPQVAQAGSDSQAPPTPSPSSSTDSSATAAPPAVDEKPYVSEGTDIPLQFLFVCLFAWLLVVACSIVVPLESPQCTTKTAQSHQRRFFFSSLP
jgi:hypothetical protein